MKYEKGTFSITPNKEVMRGKPPELQTIHFWLCERADENGICYPSRPKIAEDTGIKSLRTVDKYIQMLIDMEILVKTKRRKVGDVTNKSNLYQITVQSVPDQGANNDTYQRAPDDTITIPTINNTHLTLLSDVPSEQRDLIKELPLKFGKTAYLRLGKVYRDLWFSKYTTEYTVVSFGRLNKVFKTLLTTYSEMQIASLMYMYFRWQGGNGDDPRENIYLSGKGFPLEMMVSKLGVIIAYMTHSLNVNFEDPDSVKEYALQQLRGILRV